MTADTAVFAELLAERLGLGAGHGEVLLELQPLGLDPHGEVLQALLHLLADERFGEVVGDERRQRLAHLLPQGHLRLRLSHVAHAVGEARSELGHRLELRRVRGPLVGELGEDLLLHLGEAQLELQLALLLRVRVRGGELERGAGHGAHEVLVDLRSDGTRAHRVAVVVGRQPRLRFAVERSRDVDRDRVAALGGAVDGLQGAVEVAHAVDLGVERLLVHIGPLERDAEAAVARDLDGRPDLHDGVEGDVARLLAAGDVDLGRGDHVDVVLDDGGGVVLGERVLQGLLATDQWAEAGLEHLAGRLARPEAREADLLGDLLERGVHCALELPRLDLDGQLDLVPLEGFDGALHAEGECIGAGADA